MSERVYVNRTGDKVWSPNSKEQLCEAVESLSAEVAALRRQIEAVEAERDAARAALSKAELRERLREVERDEARAALSSVPDVPAARDDEIEQRVLVAEAQLEAIRQIINDWASDDGVIALVTLPSRIAAALNPPCPRPKIHPLAEAQRERATVALDGSAGPVAAHRRTDPACVFHEPPDPGSRLDEESRGLSCPVCIPEATR